jgi:hypothetical protein
MLAMVVGDIPGHGWYQNALSLVHPILRDSDRYTHLFSEREWERALRFCFRLLEEDSGATGADQLRSRNLAVLIRCLAGREHFYRSSAPSHTSAQFDTLVDYHLHICESTHCDAIVDTFLVLEWLGGSPSTPDQQRRYIDTMIRFSDEETTRVAVMHAAWAVESVVASMGRDDESFRERFSTALASAIMSDVTRQASLDNNPFKDYSFFNWDRDIPYLKLLCTLSQEAAWQLQLHQSGHFDNCLVIADMLSSQRDVELDEYAAPVAHIIALIDAWGEEHTCFHAVQAYPSQPLILRAWRATFRFTFFFEVNECSRKLVSHVGYLEALPSLVAYAKRRFDDWEVPLIRLVEQVCQKLDEERQRRARGDAQNMQEDSSFGHRGIPALSKQIRRFLDTSDKDV